MKICKFKDCTARALTIPDKSQSVIIERISKGQFYANHPSIQVYYPVESTDYCFYHSKLMKGMIDDHRGQNIKANTLAGRY